MKQISLSLCLVLSLITGLGIIAKQTKGSCVPGEQCAIPHLGSDKKCGPLGICPIVDTPGFCDADGQCKVVGETCTFYESESPWYKKMLGLHKKSGTVQIKSTSQQGHLLHCTDKIAPINRRMFPPRNPLQTYPLGK